MGVSDARTVAREARIKSPKVYDVLDELAAKGFATQTLGTPKRFAPVPMADVLEEERRGHLETVARLERDAPALAALFDEPVGRAATSDHGTFAMLRGRRAVVQKQRGLARAARERIVVLMSDGGAQRATDLTLLAEEATARGVRVDVVAPARSAARDLAPLSRVADVRRRVGVGARAAKSDVSCLVFDERAALLAHVVPDNASLTEGHDVAVLATEAGIVRGLAGLVDVLFHGAPKSSPRGGRAAIRPRRERKDA